MLCKLRFDASPVVCESFLHFFIDQVLSLPGLLFHPLPMTLQSLSPALLFEPVILCCLEKFVTVACKSIHTP